MLNLRKGLKRWKLHNKYTVNSTVFLLILKRDRDQKLPHQNAGRNDKVIFVGTVLNAKVTVTLQN